MSSWTNQFGVGGTLEPTDGSKYVLNSVEDPQQPKEDISDTFDGPSLAEQLAARKAEEEEEYRQRHRNLPPKALDEEEVFFLEAIQREEQIKEDLKRKQEQKDIDSFNNALQKRVIKLNDNEKIIRIDEQITNKTTSNPRTSSDIVIAPNVHNHNNGPKINLDGVVLLKKMKKKKKSKKKKKDKQEPKNKKRKLNELENSEDKHSETKRQKLDCNEKTNTPITELSEWERD